MNTFQSEMMRALGYQQIATLTTAQSLTVPSGTRLIRVVAEAQAVRWRDDATAPTATVGMPLAVGTELIYSANCIGQLKFIEQAVGAKLNISYYG